MSKNIFDPFGVFGEWKGQEPDVHESWAQTVAQLVIDDHADSMGAILSDAVYTGMNAERERIILILKQELSTKDAERIVAVIEADDE